MRGPRIEIHRPAPNGDTSTNSNSDSTLSARQASESQLAYSVGDKIHLRCSSAPSKPAATLRWLVNEREVHLPAGVEPFVRQDSADATPPLAVELDSRELMLSQQALRKHYKSIYSTHSTLSLTLQASDLIAKKLSFRCVSVLRASIELESKELITQLPQLDSSSSLLSQHVASSGGIGDYVTTTNTRHSPLDYDDSANTDSHPHHAPDASYASASAKLHYVHQPATAMLGSSLAESADKLRRFVERMRSSQEQPSSDSQPQHAMLAADNSAYLAALRDTSQSNKFASTAKHNAPVVATNSNWPYASGSSSQSATSRRRLPALLVPLTTTTSSQRSPVYVDELDARRPLLQWPPLDAGILTFDVRDGSLVASQTVQQQQQQQQLHRSSPVARFYTSMPAPVGSGDFGSDKSQRGTRHSARRWPLDAQFELRNSLLVAMNCTCVSCSEDTTLRLRINGQLLEAAKHSSHDYITIRRPAHQQHSMSLSKARLGLTPHIVSIRLMANASRHEARRMLRTLTSSSSKVDLQDSHTQSSEVLRIACVAQQSTQLNSSSEMITFDFGSSLAASDNSVEQSASASATAAASSASASSACVRNGKLRGHNYAIASVSKPQNTNELLP